MLPSPVHDEKILPVLRRTGRLVSSCVVFLGGTGFAGWVLKIPLFVRLVPGLPPIKPNTALCILLLGAALRILHSDAQSRFARRTVRLLAGIAGILAAVTLWECTMALSSTGFDQFFLRMRATRFSLEAVPGRMAAHSAVTILLGAFSLWLLTRKSPRLVQSLAILITASGIWTLLCYVFNAVSFESAATFAGMAPRTAVSFVLFGLGVLLMQPKEGVMSIFTSNSAPGAMARAILPSSILMLIALGAATAMGLSAGFYSHAFHDALLTMAGIVLVTSLIWRTAREIDATEQGRRAALDAASAQREWLQVMLSSIADAVIATDQAGLVQFLNPVAVQLTGWGGSEAVGRPATDVFRLLSSTEGMPPDDPVARVLSGSPETGKQEFATLRARNGSKLPIEEKAAPIRDSHGQLLGCVVVFRDIAERRRVEEMRREVAHQYEAMAEAIPQMVWTAQADGSVDFFNRRWLDYTGLALAKSKGWLWQTALEPSDSVVCGNRWRRSVVEGAGFEVAARIRSREGALRWHLIRALPVLDHAGKIGKWFGTCTDIDYQKRAEESLRFLADASEVLSTSHDEIETLNRIAHLAVPQIADFCTVHLLLDRRLQLAAVAHMDPRKADLMVRIDRDFPPDRAVAEVGASGRSKLFPEISDAQLGAMGTDKAHREALQQLGLASRICVSLSGRREILGVITFASAERGRLYNERDLALAEELGRRTALALDNNRLFAAVNHNKVLAETANASKDQFLAVLSHELRTPLTPVLLCVEDLSRDPMQTPPVRSAMEMIRRNIDLEARLIDDLLDITRIQSGKLRLHQVPTDAHAVLRNAIEICDADIRAKNIRVSFGLAAESRFVHADPARLQQVFWNLIKNAVKFTDGGGSIVFRSRNQTTREGIGLQIEIEDSGIGIDASVLPKIFNAFEQGEKSRSRRYGGLGLGLAISKNLVEAHGGTVQVRSPGRDLGTTFTVELATIDPSSVRQEAMPPDSERQQAGLRLLLVEDNPETGGLLRKILERRGYHVELATTMDAALTFANRGAFDLLVSDVGLPDGSGLELMQRLRQTRIVPGIAMSGFGTDEDIRRSLEAGFSDHLTKPISIAKLEEAIQKLAGMAPKDIIV